MTAHSPAAAIYKRFRRGTSINSVALQLTPTAAGIFVRVFALTDPGTPRSGPYRATQPRLADRFFYSSSREAWEVPAYVANAKEMAALVTNPQERAKLRRI